MKRVTVVPTTETATEEVQPQKRKTPDFVVEMRKNRQYILQDTKMLNSEIFVKDLETMLLSMNATDEERAKVYSEVEHKKKSLGIQMRVIQIINAFVRGFSINRVESGNVNNVVFAQVMNIAIDFMRKFGESDVNKKFDEWVVKEMKALGLSDNVKQISKSKRTIWLD